MVQRVEAEASEQPLPVLAERFDQLRRAERHAVLTRVASSLAHALGTPLNVIAGRAALAQMAAGSDGEVAENCQIISRQVRAITTLLQEVLSFARAGWPAREPVELQDLLRQIEALMRPVAAARGVKLHIERGEPTTLPLHREALLQVATTLVSFGLAPGSRLGTIRLSADSVQAEPPPAERGRVQPGQYVRLRVLLEGEQLEPALFEHVYEPWLHPTDAAGRDGALALAIAFGMAREHRGWVEQRSSEHGTSLEVHWPINAS